MYKLKSVLFNLVAITAIIHSLFEYAKAVNPLWLILIVLCFILLAINSLIELLILLLGHELDKDDINAALIKTLREITSSMKNMCIEHMQKQEKNDNKKEEVQD